jgi:hypothetical protein
LTGRKDASGGQGGGAAQAAEIDPDAKRRKWAQAIAKEYADDREKLVAAVEKCVPQ